MEDEEDATHIVRVGIAPSARALPSPLSRERLVQLDVIPTSPAARSTKSYAGCSLTQESLTDKKRNFALSNNEARCLFQKQLFPGRRSFPGTVSDQHPHRAAVTPTLGKQQTNNVILPLRSTAVHNNYV